MDVRDRVMRCEGKGEVPKIASIITKQGATTFCVMPAAPGGAPRSLIVLAHAGLALLLVDILFGVTQQDPSTSNGRRLRENKLKGKAF